MNSDFDQHEYDIALEWGLAGLNCVVPGREAVVIVDVLSFSTCVDIALGRGATVYPYRGEAAEAFAEAHGALLATRDRKAGFSLSPASLMALPPGARLVLPSPNGSTLSLSTGDVATYTACLRNADAAAAAVTKRGGRVAVVAAGERWPDGGLRPSLEDLLGAGAVIRGLPGTRSPEAALAEAALARFEARLAETLNACGSGRELIRRGCADDVALAAQLNASAAVPLLSDGAYRDARASGA